MRVLIVDDDASCREIVRLMLARLGWTLQLTSSAREALELAPVMKPDLILMDLLMPGMTGLEAVKIIKADPLLAATPVVAITALAFYDELQAALDAGFDQVISKPFTRRQLIEAVANQLPQGFTTQASA